MQRFRLRRAVNLKEPLYVVPPSSGALLSSELSVEVDRHSRLLGASYNVDMSILEKEHLGLRIRDGGARARA